MPFAYYTLMEMFFNPFVFYLLLHLFAMEKVAPVPLFRPLRIENSRLKVVI